MREASPRSTTEVALPARRANSMKLVHGAAQRSTEIAFWAEELLVHRSWILLWLSAVALRLVGAGGATTGGGTSPARPVWR